MQIVYRAGDLTEAHIVAGMLGAEGIEATVGGHYLQGGLGEIGAAGFTHVWVPDEDVGRSRQLVLAYEAEPRPVAAPDERSRRIEPWARGFVVLVLVILLSLWLAA